MMSKKSDNLYNAMKSEGLVKESYNDFLVNMRDPAKRTQMFNKAQKSGFFGSENTVEQFTRVVAPNAVTDKAQPTTATQSTQPKQKGFTPSLQQRIAAQNTFANTTANFNSYSNALKEDLGTRQTNSRKGMKFGSDIKDTRLVEKTDAETGKTTTEIERPMYSTSGAEVTNEIDKIRQDEANRANASYVEMQKFAETPQGKLYMGKALDTEADYNAAMKYLDDEEKRLAGQLNEVKRKAVDEFISKNWWQRLGQMGPEPAESTIGNELFKTEETSAIEQSMTRVQEARRHLEQAHRVKTQDKELAKEDNKAVRNLKNFGYGTQNALRGFANVVPTWLDPFDLKSLEENGNLGRIVEKQKNGEHLTKAEQDMLDAEMLKQSVEGEYDTGTGYGTIGQTTGELVNFGLSILLNPLNGFGSGLAKGTTRFLVKNLGKSVATKLARGAIRIGGDIVEGAAAALTTGGARTADDVVHRHVGNFKGGMVDGNWRAVGTEGGESWGSAIVKGITAQTIENQSELVGAYFAPLLKGVGKYGKNAIVATINKLGGKAGEKAIGKATDFIAKYSGTRGVQLLDGYLKRAGWHGSVGEFGEEIVDGVENAVTVHDRTLDTNKNTGVFNWDNMVDTALGVGVPSLVLGHLGAGGYAVTRAKLNRSYNSALKQMLEQFGNNGEAIQNKIDEMDDQQFTDYVSAQLQNKNLSEDQRSALWGYAKALKAKQYLNLSEASDIAQGMVTMVDQNKDRAFTIGYNSNGQNIGAQLTSKAKLYDDAMRRFGKKRTAELQKMTDSEAVNSLDNDRDKQMWLDVINAREAYRGAIQSRIDNREEELVEAYREANKLADTNGNVVTATDADGNKVNIISGEIVRDTNGVIDNEKSGKLVVVDADGKRRMVEASAIASVDNTTPLKDYFEPIGQGIMDKYITEEAMQKLVVGNTLPIISTSSAEPVQATIVNIDANGNVSYYIGDNPRTIITTNATYFLYLNIDAEEDEGTREEVEYAERGNVQWNPQNQQGQQVQPTDQLDENGEQINPQINEAQPTETEQETNQTTEQTTEPKTYQQGQQVALADENGEQVDATIDSQPNEDGKFIVTFDKPINGTRVAQLSADEISALEYQSTESQTETDPTQTDGSADNSPALSRIPKDKKGQPIYEQTDANTAWDAIVEQTEGDEELAKTVADSMVADKEAALKKAEKLKGKGATVSEKIANVKAVAQAEAELAHWKEIASTLDRRKQTTEETTSNAEQPTANAEESTETAPQAAEQVNVEKPEEATPVEETAPTEADKANAVQPTEVEANKETETAPVAETETTNEETPTEVEKPTEEAPTEVKAETAPTEVTDNNKANAEVETKEETPTEENAGTKKDNRSNLFQYFTGSIKELIEAAKDTGNKLVKKIIAPASNKLVDELKEKGVDISTEYNHVIDNNAINHTLNNHSDEKEELRGQVPLTVEDIEKASDIIDNYDEISTSKNKRGQDVVIYKKHYEDGTTLYVEEVRVGRKELALASMRKYKSGKLTDAKSDAPLISDLSAASQGKGNTPDGTEQEQKLQTVDNGVADEKIEDVGEKIGGAKKDKYADMKQRIREDSERSDDDLLEFFRKNPVSKIFNFDFAKLREGGASNEAVSFVVMVKNSIPAKPRTAWKLKSWASDLLTLYRVSLAALTNFDKVQEILNKHNDSLTEHWNAYMSVGGFDGGLNIGKAGLRQLSKESYTFKDGQRISNEGKWYLNNAGGHGGIYDTKEEAVEALKAFAGKNAVPKDKQVKFEVYGNRTTGEVYITPKGKADVVIQGGFKSVSDAFKYLDEHNAELQERYRTLMDKTKVELGANRERKGRDYRGGKDVSADGFMQTFGFRGVEFGNWMKQEDRAKALNECYDALMDMADVCGVSPKALSLDGKLGMAFGSRGGGKFNAHYEPGKEVINLTKTKGAGSLAHEWFHALDNYFAKMGGAETSGFATSSNGMRPNVSDWGNGKYRDLTNHKMISKEEYEAAISAHPVRKEMADAWEHLIKQIRKSDYGKRSMAYAGLHNSKYWSEATEMGARAFSAWVENELSKRNATNDYLANDPKLLEETLDDDEKRFKPYPFNSDAEWMDEAFGNLFSTMQERVDEGNGNHVLYSKKTSPKSKLDIVREMAERADAERKAGTRAVRHAKVKGRKAIETVADALGYKVEWVPTDSRYNGKVDHQKKVITIAEDAEMPLEAVMGHEATHAIRRLGEEQYTKLRDAVRELVGEDAWNALIEQKRTEGNYTDDKVEEEVTADLVGRVISDGKMMGGLAQKLKGEPTILGKLREIFQRLVDALTKSGNTEAADVMKRNLKAFDAVVESFTEAAEKVYDNTAEVPSSAEIGENLSKKVKDYEPTAVPWGNGILTEGGNSASDYSVRSIARGAGFEIKKTDDHTVVIKDKESGVTYDKNNPITADILKAKADSILNHLVTDTMTDGLKAEIENIYKSYADFLNRVIEKGDKSLEYLADQWALEGEAINKTVSPNADKQYSFSLDITRVCKKNEAVIFAISELQKEQGYGVTPAQILDIYMKTQQAGFQVPCPVCYVFSRYIYNGQYATVLINAQKKYQNREFTDGKPLMADPSKLTAQEKKARIDFWLKELDEAQKNKDKYKKEVAKAKDDIRDILKEVDGLTIDITSGKLKGDELREAEERVQQLSKQYEAALNVVAQTGIEGWIVNVAIGKKKGKWTLREDSWKEYPEKFALDLRLSAETKKFYPGIARYRNSRGSAAGKEIAFAADNDFGDVTQLLGTSKTALDKGRNYYAEALATDNPVKRERLLKKARTQLDKARTYAAQQMLRGGVRQWSWSDNIERLAPDVMINSMQLTLLQSALQTYSKQLEGIELMARLNGYVNGSLMGKGKGYKEVDKDYKDGPVWYNEENGKYYALEFDSTVGVEPFSKNGKLGLFDLNKMYDRAGNILVGMNDIHVKTAMADPRIFFIIPWHKSGMSNHILKQFYAYLGIDLGDYDSTDYTATQEEKKYGADSQIPSVVHEMWESHNYNGKFKCGLGVIPSGKGKLSEKQLHYRELRDAILLHNANPAKQSKADRAFWAEHQDWLEEINNDEFLKQTLDKVSKTVGVLGKAMTKTDTEFVYPYEYWDTSSTIDGREVDGVKTNDADINGERYLEYCRRLGFRPKFCGIANSNNGEVKTAEGNFCDSKGYWKLLIDRRMYDTKGRYQDLTPVTFKNFDVDLLDPEKTDKRFDKTVVADDKATKELVGKVLEHESERGVVPTVDYGLTLDQAVDKYNDVVDYSARDKKTASIERSDAVSHNSSYRSLPAERKARLSDGTFSAQQVDAKVKENTQTILSSIRKIQNQGHFSKELPIGTPMDAVRILGNDLKMQKAKKTQSYYGDYYETDLDANGTTIKLRIATHPATGERMGIADADKKISLVVYKNGEHKANKAHDGYSEYVYYPEKVSPRDAAFAIVDGVKSLIETGKFTDSTGKVEIQHYPYVDKDGTVQYSTRRHSDAEKEMAEIRYRRSDELTEEYGDRWLSEQTNEDGRHTTQVKNTINSYKKFGEWVKTDSKGKDVSILDASSGLGLGTEWMRENGMTVDDVEPYPSESRKAPTFASYDDIDKKYDYVISNAVLNVIPDDWRANVLHDMADKLKVGGKMVINVRGANTIAKQGKEGVTRITLDDPSEILVLRPDGTIKAYQKGFTKDELKKWCEKELGDGYSVEIATKKNAGDSYDTAVVVAKNNESNTSGIASGQGHPRWSAQPVPNSTANLSNKTEIANELDGISAELERKGEFGAHEFLYYMSKAFGYKGTSLKDSYYKSLGNNVGIRIADHYASADNFEKKGNDNENYGLVVKLSPHRFKDNDRVDYLEYVYFPDKLDGKRQADIVKGLKTFVQTGDFSALPHPDKVNPSGKFKRQQKNNRAVLNELVNRFNKAGIPVDMSEEGQRVIDAVNNGETAPDGARMFRTRDGEVYGFVKDGKVYLDPRIATSETAIHEYTHLFGDMVRATDSKQWAHLVNELKGSVLWNEVKQTYKELKTDDEIADEVFATFSGRHGAERIDQEVERILSSDRSKLDKAVALAALQNVRDAIRSFWRKVAELFGIHRMRSAEELADMALADLLDAKNPLREKEHNDFKTYHDEQALNKINDILANKKVDTIMPSRIADIEEFRTIFANPIQTVFNENIKVKDAVFNKILRNSRESVSGAILPTLQNADFGIRDLDGSILYVKRFKKEYGDAVYNVAVVNKHGELEDYISSVHIKNDNNLKNKIAKGAELLLPIKRDTYGLESQSNSTPHANVENNSEQSNRDGENNGIRFSRQDNSSVDYSTRAQARDRYETRVKSGLFQTQESLQNSMLGLQEALLAVDRASGNKRHIEDIEDWENPVLGENRLSSVNKAEIDAAASLLFHPLMETVSKLTDHGKNMQELTDYMMAKHGLERNLVMAEREAKKKAQEEFSKDLAKAKKALAKDPNNKTLQDAVKKVEDDINARATTLRNEYRLKDYAGITALAAEYDSITESYIDQIAQVDEQISQTTDKVTRGQLQAQRKVLQSALLRQAESVAQRIDYDYETKHANDMVNVNGVDKMLTTVLWEQTNAVTDATLSKARECGFLTNEQYADISSMYSFYIPLRGFDVQTSAEAYAYLNHGESAFNAPIKRAKGRKSKADNPFAYMQSMMESGILQGNRNVLVKQSLLNFALNHPSDLMSVSELWLQYDAVNDEWIPVTPTIDENHPTKTVAEQMDDFEASMQNLSAQSPDLYKKASDAVNIPYRVVEKTQLNEHQVLVRKNGKDYIVTINGNPRAAQAANGLTNPDSEKGAIGAVLSLGDAINRKLAAFYTTRNPDFTMSNFVRDMIYSNTMVWVKESPSYALTFHKNCTKFNPIYLTKLFKKWEAGKLDLNNKDEKLIYEFMRNGGETGYVAMKDIEQRKSDIAKEIKRIGKCSVYNGWRLLIDEWDELNRSVENCARVAAYVTSREKGRSIGRAIYDAKEISVNFNRKGSGATFVGANEQTKIGNIAAVVSGLGRCGYLFWNAGIQGLTNYGRQFKRHPGKAWSLVAGLFLAGFIKALAGGDDDDDDENNYYNLPEYVRRSSICIKAGDSWVTIPLSVEYRSMYGLGELAASVATGHESGDTWEITQTALGQVSQILPLDLMEGGGGHALIPSSVKPAWEAFHNEGWTGLPIYKETTYNKYMPNWTKAYKSTNKQLVNLSAMLNEWTGGDDYTKGGVDLNPARIEYIMRGYLGGMFGLTNNLVKVAEITTGKRDFEWQSVPIADRFIKTADERTQYRALSNEYYKMKEEADETSSRASGYLKGAKMGKMEYLKKLDEFMNSKAYERKLYFDAYDKAIKKIREAMQYTTDTKQLNEMQQDIYRLQREALSEIDSISSVNK